MLCCTELYCTVNFIHIHLCLPVFVPAQDTVYPIAFWDSDGSPLTGANGTKYTITFKGMQLQCWRLNSRASGPRRFLNGTYFPAFLAELAFVLLGVFGGVCVEPCSSLLVRVFVCIRCA